MLQNFLAKKLDGQIAPQNKNNKNLKNTSSRPYSFAAAKKQISHISQKIFPLLKGFATQI